MALKDFYLFFFPESFLGSPCLSSCHGRCPWQLTADFCASKLFACPETDLLQGCLITSSSCHRHQALTPPRAAAPSFCRRRQGWAHKAPRSSNPSLSTQLPRCCLCQAARQSGLNYRSKSQLKRCSVTLFGDRLLSPGILQLIILTGAIVYFPPSLSSLFYGKLEQAGKPSISL